MLGIHEILRAQDVKRWGIVRMAKQQTLAEHSFNVAMIARAFAKAADYPDEQITKAALCHDLDEIITGDIPTPFKAMAKDQGMDLNSIYEHATGRGLDDMEIGLVKLADIVEAYWFATEYGIGQHAAAVAAELGGLINTHMEDCGFVGSDYEVGLRKVISKVMHGKHHA